MENEALRRSDKLRAALLNSISHDLRTPLSTVLGSATTLIDYGETLKPKVRADLLISIREEAERLNRYVGNLLDMTRLEGGALKTRSEWTDVRDVLGAAIGRVERRLEQRKLTRDFPVELTSVETDPGLLEQAIVNILENAIAYSPDGSLIELATYEDRGNIVISIEDEGPGIPQSDIERASSKSSAAWKNPPTARRPEGLQQERGPGPVDRQGFHRSHEWPHRRRQPVGQWPRHPHPDQPAEVDPDSPSVALRPAP